MTSLKRQARVPKRVFRTERVQLDDRMGDGGVKRRVYLENQTAFRFSRYQAGPPNNSVRFLLPNFRLCTLLFISARVGEVDNFP